jgi:hypothetical protein
MTSDNRHEAKDGVSAFDPAGLGRPTSAARAIAEQTERSLLRALQEQFDHLLPPGSDLGKIRPPQGWHVIQNLADFTRHLDRLAARHAPLAGAEGGGAVLPALWQTLNAIEAGHSIEEVHGRIKQLDEHLDQTVRLVHQVFEKPNPDDPSGPKIVPAERMAQFKLLLDIVHQLFAMRRIALTAEIGAIETALWNDWYAAGEGVWNSLDDKWREWADD